jgi:Tfp pilus assembly protein PilE
MIVVSITGILAAGALPQYQNYATKSKFAEVEGCRTLCDTSAKIEYSAPVSPNTVSIAITAPTEVVTGTASDNIARAGAAYTTTPALTAGLISCVLSGAFTSSSPVVC